MTIVQMITVDRVGCETFPVEVEASRTDPLLTTAKNLISAAAKKFKAVTKQSRAYHGGTGLEITGNIEFDNLSGAFVVFSGKGGWKGAARLSVAHENVHLASEQGFLEVPVVTAKVEESMPQESAVKAMPVAQDLDLPSSGPDSSSDAEEGEPRILLVYNRRPFNDWAATLCSYLRTRFQVRARALGVNVRRIGLLARLELDNPANLIVPVGREVTEFVAARGCNSLVCGAEVYAMLDHKGAITSLEFPSSIPQIPTYVNPPNLTSVHATLSDFKSFVSRFEAVIVKPAEEAGSRGQNVLSRERVEGLCETWSNGSRPVDLADTVVQPYLKDHITVEFNFFARDGELIEWLCTYATRGITEQMWTNGTSLQTYDGEELSKMVEFASDAVRFHQLQGLMEFEFLISGNEVYFLEVNPRVSSSVTGFDSNGYSPYIEKLVVPYLQSFGWLKDKEVSNWQAPRVFCPPSKSATDFWQENYQKHLMRNDLNGGLA